MIKRAILATLILNSIILVGVPAGHGFGLMIMVEYIGLSTLVKSGFNLQTNYPIESSFILIAIVAAIGKLMLLLLLFQKQVLTKSKLIYFSLIVMLIPFFALCYLALDYDPALFAITLGSGVPFLMYFARVLYLLRQDRIKSD